MKVCVAFSKVLMTVRVVPSVMVVVSPAMVDVEPCVVVELMVS